MNIGCWTVNLGADPESIQLGEKEGRKLRCAEKAPGKRNITRWFNAIVVGYDNETADKLKKGDTVILQGQMAKQEYKPKQPRYKGEMREVDEMPFAKIFQVVKSKTFFAEEGDAAEGDGVSATEEPSLTTDEPAFDPLAGIA